MAAALTRAERLSRSLVESTVGSQGIYLYLSLSLSLSICVQAAASGADCSRCLGENNNGLDAQSDCITAPDAPRGDGTPNGFLALLPHLKRGTLQENRQTNELKISASVAPDDTAH